jgi:hypothetical protein
MWWFKDSLIDIDPYNLVFIPNEPVSSLDLCPSLHVDTYFSKKLDDDDNISTKR